MKLMKPFNQLRNVLQSVPSVNAYRFLSILMTALLFLGLNGQVMAAAVASRVNTDSNNNISTSGDKFNAQSLLQASNSNTDENQHWTWGEEIAAGIFGVALLGAGAAGGWKFYTDRQARTEKKDGVKIRERSSFSETDNPAGLEERSKSIEITEDSIHQSAGNENSANHDSLDPQATLSWKAKLAACGQKSWGQLTALISSWRANPAVEKKPAFQDLAEVHTGMQKKKLAEENAQQSVGAMAYDLLTLKKPILPEARTARQQKAAQMATLETVPIHQLTAGQYFDFDQYKQYQNLRQQKIDALNPESTIEEVLATLDPEVKDAIREPLALLSSNQQGKLAYFVAKSEDEWHPGHLSILAAKIKDSADTESSTHNESQALVEKLNEEIEARWVKDTIGER